MMFGNYNHNYNMNPYCQQPPGMLVGSLGLPPGINKSSITKDLIINGLTQTNEKHTVSTLLAILKEVEKEIVDSGCPPVQLTPVKPKEIKPTKKGTWWTRPSWVGYQRRTKIHRVDNWTPVINTTGGPNKMHGTTICGALRVIKSHREWMEVDLHTQDARKYCSRCLKLSAKEGE